MKWTKVQSSSVSKVALTNDILYVIFTSNKIYKYENVTQEVFNELLKSESVGKFLHKNIIGKYKATKVEDETIFNKD